MPNAKCIDVTDKSIPPMPADWPRHLIDEYEASKLLDTPVPTLRDWRSRKTRSLPYIKLGTSKRAPVKYEPGAVWRWLCANTVTSIVTTA